MPSDPAADQGRALKAEWTRQDWIRFADLLLASARRYASPGHARITPPGPEGGYGRAVDGLEGFARTFLLAGFRIAGERGAGLDELADWYAAGIATGTDPASPERWVRLTEHAQAKVEAASIALVLDLTRPWIWDRLTPAVQERVVEYLAPAVGDPTYPQINWVWFRIVVQTFLRSVGGPSSVGEITQDLATHDTFLRADGWLSDGPERAFDHYAGWALHLYPTLWARMSGAAELADERRERDVAALDRFLQDAVALVGADGSPLIQGRSLIYRFAAAAPFWVGAIAGVPSLTPGQLRYAAGRVVAHFAERGVPDERGLLTLGWHGSWPRLAQAYSGPGSPYWASKGLLGLALPEDHPAWTSPAEPLPVETDDFVRAVRAPGWLISGTRADGIVRVHNHGTDHAAEGSTGSDSPLYARLGYSTATAPVLDEDGWTGPADQCVAVIDAQGQATHRSGMRTLIVRVDGGEAGPVGVAGSTTLAHWVGPDPGQRDHGSGRTGKAVSAGRLTVYSLVRAGWELRLCRVDDVPEGLDPGELRLRIAGWPVAGDAAADVSAAGATVTGAGLTSSVDGVPIGGAASDAPAAATAGVSVHDDAGPLGDPVRVPWLDHALRPGAWVAALLELSGNTARQQRGTCRVHLDAADQGPADQGSGSQDRVGRDSGDQAPGVRVEWPDGRSTYTHLSTRTGRGSRSGDPVAVRAL
ncbi:MAG TPA: DUF2264 domain-containing protein [Actinocrinis sp.]|uniref:DUF2264 domain-containing protein n=1 Tax=Actinocrinis sp. TaxID=1920516 RepID=UPI002D61EDDE|nr:DUF2264 domain-containing protein [Actinocrinis sp.]HZU55293.1 DUF2264 domain-containing protein [Actinocrinis sp.]